MGVALGLVGCSAGVKSSNDESLFGDPTYNPTKGDDADAGTSATPAGDTEAISATDTQDGGSDTGDTGDTSTLTECGDGVMSGTETCDTEDFGGQACADFGFESGLLVCSEDCSVLTEGCYSCGDGSRSLTEACDGTDFGGETCESMGYGGGALGCAADCASVDTVGCTPLASCGDNARDTGEECDGADLAGSSCTALGFDQGNLGCNAGSCTFNTTGCSYLNCAGEGDFCLFDQDNPQSNCCPPGVGGNVFGLCALAICT